MQLKLMFNRSRILGRDIPGICLSNIFTESSFSASAIVPRAGSIITLGEAGEISKDFDIKSFGDTV